MGMPKAKIINRESYEYEMDELIRIFKEGFIIQ